LTILKFPGSSRSFRPSSNHESARPGTCSPGTPWAVVQTRGPHGPRRGAPVPKSPNYLGASKDNDLYGVSAAPRATPGPSVSTGAALAITQEQRRPRLDFPG